MKKYLFFSVFFLSLFLHQRANAIIDSATFVVNPPLCNNPSEGPSVGSITATVYPLTGNYSYKWEGGTLGASTATGNPLSNIGEGYFLLTVTDSSDLNNLSEEIYFIKVDAPAPLGIAFPSITKIVPSCNGYCDGSIRGVSVSGGGTPPYTYLWSNGDTNQTATSLCATPSIALVIKDARGCKKRDTTFLTEPTPLVVTKDSANISCNGNCDGKAKVTLSGGVPPYSHKWSTGSVIDSIVSLCSGSYSDTIRDKRGCSQIISFTISEPAVLRDSATSTSMSCNGVLDGTVASNPSGGTLPYSYSWDNGGTTKTITGLDSGTYIITLTDKGLCSFKDTVVITEPSEILSNITKTDIVCFNACDGKIITSPTGGTSPYTFAWSTGRNTPNSLTDSITALCPGTYQVIITDAHLCTDTQNIVVTEPDSLIAGATNTNMGCSGVCDGTAEVSISGGVSPFNTLWSNAATDTTITGLCTGQYSVIITDSNGCKAYDTVAVSNPPLLTVSVADGNVSCFGKCDASLTATPAGGTPPYSNYSWNSAPVQTTPTATGLCISNYIVIVKDSKGCSATDTALVNDPPKIIPNITKVNISCNGNCNGTATSTPSGGAGAPYTYSWSTVPVQTTQTATGLCANIAYTLTVTDSSGCSLQQIDTLTEAGAFVSTDSITDVSCFGDSSGQVTLTLSGGTPAYNVSWNTVPVQSGTTIANLIAGTYIATITDSMNCVYTDTVVIAEPVILNAGVTSVNITCKGASDGTAKLNPTGGTSPYLFSWDTGKTTQSVSGLSPGTYIGTVTDSKGCIDKDTIIISEPLGLNASIVKVNASCSAVCNGSAILLVGGGSPPYTVLWNNGSASDTLVNLCIGSYSVTITDSKGCSDTVSSSINSVLNIVANSSGAGLNCFGSCNAQATVTASGGTAPYTYVWAPGAQTGQTASNLCAGTYTVTATDSIGCISTSNITFNNPSALTLTITNVVNSSCGSSCNGSATATAGGGTGTLTYLWNTVPAQTTDTAANLCAGVYTVTVTDQNNCSITDSVTITAPLAIANSSVVTNASCNQADGKIVLSPTGGTLPYAFTWSDGQISNPAVNLVAGTYWVAIIDSALCTDTFTIIVNNLNAPSLTASSTSTKCPGSCDGTADVTVSGGTPGYTYSWNTNPVQTTATATGLCAGIYIATVTDSLGCKVAVSDTVQEPAPITSNPSVTDVTCGGFSNGSINLSVAGGNGSYTYLWQGAQTTASIAGLTSGDYIVTIKDVKLCSITDTITVGAVTTINTNADSANVTCNGACDGFVSVNPTGGVSPYSYTWFPSGPDAPSKSSVCFGNYSVTIEDKNGCTVNRSFTITEPSAINVSSSKTDVSCYGDSTGTVSVTTSGGSGAYTYFWTGTGQTTSSISNLKAGTYSVTVSDSANSACSVNKSITINEPPLLSVAVSGTDLNCNGVCTGTVTANATGGTGASAYTWMPGNLSGNAQSNLCAAIYTVTVKDVNNCVASNSVTINQPSLIVPNADSANASCNEICDGTALVNPTGGAGFYTYMWSPGGQTVNSLNSLCAGSYTVTITDTNACAITKNFSIAEPTAITAAVASQDATCNKCDGSATVTPSGGSGSSYTYKWNDTAAQTTASATNLCAGLYNVIITDGTSCSDTTTITLNNLTAPVTSHISTDAVCNKDCNGSATVSANGANTPFGYLWTPGGNTSNSATNLCAGTYNVKVTDALSCISFETVVINEPAAVQGNPASTNITCTSVCDGKIDLSPSGGDSVYTYSWSGGLADTANVKDLCLGTYTVLITDGKGCKGNDTIKIDNPNPLTVSQSSVMASCKSSCNGIATVKISGGASPYTVIWSTGDTVVTNGTSIKSGLCAGAYTATIKDSKSCSTMQKFTITQPAALVSDSVLKHISCNGSSDGSISLNPSGGTGSYTIKWTPGDSTGTSISGLSIGTYNVLITDSNACTLSQSFTLTQPLALTASVSRTNASCNKVCDASATVIPDGGTTPYSYLWTPGGYTVNNPDSLCAGVYTVAITDSNGCTVNPTVTITEPQAIIANDTVTKTPLCGASDGQAQVNPTGGAGAPYTISWSNGDAGTMADSLSAGIIYTVTITDKSGCSQDFTISISNTNAPVVVPAVTDVTCNNKCNGFISLAVSGGTGGYTYSWASMTYTTSSIGSLCVGTYTVSVQDSIGCITVKNISVQEPAALLSNSIAINTSCGGTDGKASVAPSGGTAPYKILWSNSSTLDSITGLSAGTYPVTITDSKNCSLTENVLVGNTSGPTGSTLTTINVKCSKGTDGSVIVNPVGGTPPYTYSWQPNVSTTKIAANLSAGDYTVTITDSSGCKKVLTTTLNTTSTISENTVVNDATCKTNDGSITLKPSGGVNPYTYSWTGSLLTTSSRTSLNAGLYTATITDSIGCSKTVSIPISNKNAPTLTVSGNSPGCKGGSDGSASVSASGGSGKYSYLWTPGGMTSDSINGLSADTFFIQVTDSNGCLTISSVTIQDPAALSTNAVVTNASCGSANGKVVVVPSGGTAPYKILWSNSSTLDSITGLSAGTYPVTITDSKNCSLTENVLVGNTSGPTGSTLTTINVKCSKGTDGSVIVNPVGGTPPYTYSWQPNVSTTKIAANLSAGNYTVTITDSSGCKKVLTATINTTSTISENSVVNDATCKTNDGSITLKPSGGVNPYTYSWSGSLLTTSSRTSLNAGLYTATITDSIACSKTVNISVSNKNAPTLTVSGNSPGCKGGSDGTASVSASGGSGQYSYLWTPGAKTTSSISNLSADTFFIQVTDLTSGCLALSSVNIQEPAALSLNSVVINSSCGAANGIASVAPTGGTAPYKILWSNGSALNSISGLLPGYYSVTITDSKACSLTDSVLIGSNGSPTVTAPLITDVKCFGGNDGSVTLNPVGGTLPYTYSWLPNVSTTKTATDLTADDYTVQITDAAGCMKAITVTVKTTSSISENADVTNATCNVNDGSITLKPSGGVAPYTYSWSGSLLTTSSRTGLNAGLYTVTITDSIGCSKTVSKSVSNKNGPTLTVSVNNPSCKGDSDGSASVSASGGSGKYSYLWTPGGMTSDSINGLSADTFFIQVTDSNGCLTISSVTIQDPAVLSTNAVVTNASCGSANGKVVVVPSGGTAPYKILWSNASTADSLTGLSTGTYSVKITDSKGCSLTDNNILVGNNGSPTITAPVITNVKCFGGNDGIATVNPVGGTPPYTYNWLPGGQTTQTATNLRAGDYTVQITDTTGCMKAFTATVKTTTSISENADVTDATCNANDGSITLKPSGGVAPYTYSWKESLLTTSSRTGLNANLYTVTISEAGGCSKTVKIPLSNKNAPDLKVSSSNLTCNGSSDGSAFVSASGGSGKYSYLWTPGGMTTNSINSLSANTFFIKVTDDTSGCITISSVVIKEPAAISTNAIVTATSCGSANGKVFVTPSGGTVPYKILWSNGSTADSLISLSAGIYPITITDSIGCSLTENVLVSNIGGPIVASPTVTGVKCFGGNDGSATVNPVGGIPPYVYNWLPGGQTTQTATNLSTGNYIVEVMDSIGCRKELTAIINSTTTIIDNQVVTDATCNNLDGTITLNPSGGIAPYTYLWLGSLPDSSSQTGLFSGIYNVTITETGGCSKNVDIIVNNSNAPTSAITSINTSCNAACDGSASVNVSGGSGTYSYLWIPGGMTINSVGSLCADTFFVQVTDDTSGCIAISSVIIAKPDSVSYSLPIVTNALCGGTCNGTATVFPIGGTLPYSYSWSNGDTTQKANALCAGTNTATIKDAKLCSSSQKITIKEPSSIVIDTALTLPLCSGINTGKIDITVAGGSSPYTYQWSGGSTAITEDIANIPDGTYIITVTDTTGCLKKDTLILPSLAIVSADAGSDTLGCQGAFALDAGSSKGATSYQWFELQGMNLIGNSGSPTLTVNPSIGSTSYLLVVSNGVCSDSDTIVITSNPLPSAAAGDNTFIFVDHNITIGGNPTGDIGSTYRWTPSYSLSDSTIANPLATPITTTIYTVNVTNASGCSATDSIEVEVLPEITSPNGLSPNNDGINDTWAIDRIELFPNCLVEIYNRWGELLFSSPGYVDKWDATYKGKPLPVGTYYYIIKLNDPAFPDAITGPITIMR